MTNKSVTIIEPKDHPQGKWAVKVVTAFGVQMYGPFDSYKDAETETLKQAAANIVKYRN